MVPILARASLGRHALATEVPVVARETAAAREIEAPVVQAAREHAAVDIAEPGEIGLGVRAPTFDAPSVALEELVGAPTRRAETLLHIRHALRRERFEEGQDELVERPVAVRGEAAREQERVDPIF